MAFSLKNIIWNLFGVWEQKSDTIRNGSNKGIRQRYNELIAEEYDENTQTLIDGLVSNTIVPRAMLERFMPYWEETLGSPNTGMSTSVRRKMIGYAIKFNQAKGTITGLRMLFALAGCICTITEEYDSGSFDGGIFDNGEGFDKDECSQYCGRYSIAAYGTQPDSVELQALLLKLALLNTPINVQITGITYVMYDLELSLSITDPDSTDSFFGTIEGTTTGGSGDYEYELIEL